jgi:hypothetical protein
MFSGQPREKECKTPTQPIKSLVALAHTCHPCHIGSINESIEVQASLHKRETLLEKMAKAKRIGGRRSTSGRAPDQQACVRL